MTLVTEPLTERARSYGVPSTRVIRWVTRALAHGDLVAGQSLPAERDLALRLGVARTTVRAALQRLADEGVVRQPGKGCAWRAVAREGTEPTGQRTMLHRTVAVLGARRVRAPLPAGYESTIHASAVDALEEAGFHVLAVNLQTLDDGGGASLATLRPDGLLLTYDAGEVPQAVELALACHREGVPVVAYGGGEALKSFDRVDSDHATGAYEETRHLLALGCRRILCFWRFPQAHAWVRQREEGYARAMREAGLEPLPPIRTPDIEGGPDESEQSFRHLARTLAGYLCDRLATPAGPVDALLTATDRHALQTAAALRLLGRTPGRDIQVAGYDNYWSGCVERAWEPTPPAVTADKDNARLGAELAHLLDARLKRKSPPDADGAQPVVRIVAPRLVLPG